MNEAQLHKMERTVIDAMISAALTKARQGPRSTFTATLLRWLPSDATRPDCIWVDVALLRDDELRLMVEER